MIIEWIVSNSVVEPRAVIVLLRTEVVDFVVIFVFCLKKSFNVIGRVSEEEEEENI